MIRKIARPMLASVFVADGVDTLMNQQDHLEGAREVLSKVRAVVPAQYSQLVPKDPQTAVQAVAGTKVAAGALYALGKFPRTAATALAVNPHDTVGDTEVLVGDLGGVVRSCTGTCDPDRRNCKSESGDQGDSDDHQGDLNGARWRTLGTRRRERPHHRVSQRLPHRFDRHLELSSTVYPGSWGTGTASVRTSDAVTVVISSRLHIVFGEVRLRRIS